MYLLTMFRDLGKFRPLRIIDTIVPFAGDIDAEYDGLINHLVKVNSSTDVLRNLGLSVDEQVSRNMHELYESGEVFLYGGMVLDDSLGALLGADPLVRVIETRQRPNRACGETGDSGGKYLGQPYPDCDIARKRFSGQ